MHINNIFKQCNKKIFMKKHVNAVGIIFETLDGKILTLLRSDKNSKEEECGTWGLVGGKIEKDEQPLYAAIRETKEEIDYNIDTEKLQKLNEYFWDRDNISIKFFTYKINIVKEFNPTLMNDEHIRHEWVKPLDCYQKNNLMLGLYDIIKKEYMGEINES